MPLTKPVLGICFSLLLMTVGITTSAATIPVSAASQNSQRKEDADAAYNAGVSLVYSDRRLETAAVHLGEAVRLDPQNGKYRLALGCAYVRRAHALRDASGTPAYYETLKASYSKRYANWEQAQKDSENALYGAKPPAPPVPPTTRDDGKAFTLTPEQTKERVNALCRKALAEWDAALANAHTDSERANIHYVRGWGMIVIQRMGYQFVQNPVGSQTFGEYRPWLDEKLVPSRTQIVEAFQSALTLAPKNAQYWQSLGDAYVAESDPKLWDREKATEAYEKALALDRRSATLWYQLYKIQQRNTDSATNAIRTAAQVDSGNAFYNYLLADLLLKRSLGGNTPFSSSNPPDLFATDLVAGIAALEKGNTGTFRPVTYTYAIPKILAPLNPSTNALSESDALSDYIMVLPQNVDKIVKAYLAKEDSASAVTAASAAVRFSDRMMALGDTQSNPVSEWLALTFGSNAIQTSYTSLTEALEQAGNASAATEAQTRMQERIDLAKKRLQRAHEETKSLQK